MRPLKAPFMPKVKIREGTWKNETPIPFIAPTSIPISTANTSISRILPFLFAICPAIVAVSPITAPIDTSISPVIITKAIPIASKVNTTDPLKEVTILE